MLKSFLMLVILCSVLQLSHGEKLKCEFKDQYYHVVGTVYSCIVTSLDNSYDNMTIDGYTGTHLANKNDKDVKAIYIHDGNTKYIPANLGSFSNLLTLLIDSSQLVEIRSKDFYGMQNLEQLSLSSNKLTSVPSDTFSMLPKLKLIYLSFNQIKYIGSGAFDELKNLNEVYLQGNICVNKDYYGATAITQMKEDIKANCDKPNDVIQYEITNELKELITGIQEEALMNQEELKKMINKLFKASEEHQENLKLRTDLSTAQDQQKKALDEIDQLKKELNDLKKQLSEAEKTIEEKLPKMEQTINEFHMEVMDQKIERHHQRELYREIRSKLMKCEKEKLEV